MWYEKTKTGKYKYTERYFEQIKNKYRYVSVTIDTKNDKKAKDILSQKISTLTNNLGMYKSNATLEFILEQYLDYQKNIKQVKLNTFKRNKNSLELMLTIIPPKSIVDDLKVLYIRQLLIKSGKPNTTLNEYIRRFNAMIRWAYRNDLIKTPDLAEKLDSFPDMSEREKIKDKFLEQEEARMLLEYLYNKNIRLGIMTEFLLNTGLRFGEMAALTWNDIDFTNQIISVNKTYDVINGIITTTKTLSSTRLVGGNDKITTLLKGIKSINNIINFNNIVFPNEKGNYYQIANFNKHLKKAKKDLKLNKTLTSHTLRHTHASLLFEQGLDFDTISRRLGHSNSDITKQIYIHITNLKQQEDFKKIKQVKIL